MHENTTDVDRSDMFRAQALRCRVLMGVFVDSQFLHGKKLLNLVLNMGTSVIMVACTRPTEWPHESKRHTDRCCALHHGMPPGCLCKP